MQALKAKECADLDAVARRLVNCFKMENYGCDICGKSKIGAPVGTSIFVDPS